MDWLGEPSTFTIIRSRIDKGTPSFFSECCIMVVIPIRRFYPSTNPALSIVTLFVPICNIPEGKDIFDSGL
jgi:hypothetical protein